MKYLANFAWTGNPNHHLSYFPQWEQWSNTSGAPKAIVFDADFDHAHIGMMTEELTVEGVTADFEAAMTNMGLSPLEKAAARLFQFSKPW